jgi:hypothetical protein
MRPSDKVWKGISKNLHERRRRIVFATGTFLMIALFSGFFLTRNSKDIQLSSASANAKVKNHQDNVSRPSPIPNNYISEQNKAPISNKISSPVISSSSNKIKAVSYLISPKLEQTFFETTLESIIPFEPITERPFIFSIDNYSTKTSIPVDVIETESKKEIPAYSEELFTNESLANVFGSGNKKNKLTFQLFFTPTISYRKLSENKSYLNAVPQSSASTNYAALYDINNVVTHRPNMGLELGFAAKYPVAKSIKLRGGLQFNLSGYDIKSFTYTPEVAILALNSGYNQVDYVGTVTTHRNFNGGKTEWLKNFYLQLSAPIGFEAKLLGNRKTSLGIASTLQPTYIIGDRAYLLSTDYKNYTEVPYLTRRWNVNTSLETFISYSTGKMNWQVGPQVRYQLLSSFVDKYPIKENLFDFGLKVGVSINKTNTVKDP